MIIQFLKYILKRRMSRIYKKTEENDYSDCGFPDIHLRRDMYLTYEKILYDDYLRKTSLLSWETYAETVDKYYAKIEKI